jgi:hypothetical protein
MTRALAALAAALLFVGCSDGGIAILNTAPSVSILEPESGSLLREGVAVTFRAIVADPGGTTAALLLSWSSSTEGTLWTGEPVDGRSEISVDLAAGEHEVTLRAVDPLGSFGTDTVLVTVVEDLAPSLGVLSPLPDAVLHDDFPVILAVHVGDEEDDAEDLIVEWYEEAGLIRTDSPDDSGGLSFSQSFAMGTHVLTVGVTDSADNLTEQTLLIDVLGPNHPPTCELTAPAAGTQLLQFSEVELRGTANDEDVTADRLTVHWSTSSGVDLGMSTPTGGGAVNLLTTELPPGPVTIEMTVIDEVGVTCVDSVDVDVVGVPDVTITTPSDGATLGDAPGVLFEGIVSDYEDLPGDLAVNWESDVDGYLGSSRADAGGNVSLVAPALSLGGHVITLSAVDDDGHLGADTIAVSVNGAPSPPTIALDPPAPTTVDALVASVTVESQDPEGAAITYAWTWDIGGVAQAGLAGATTVPAGSTTRDEVWTVTVTASDGLVSSPPVSQTVTILNTAPATTTPTITPVLLYTDSNATCNAGTSTDADGDPVTVYFSWEIGGVPSSQTGPVHSGITPPGFDLGDGVVCIATPHDGTTAGAPVASASMTVSNTAPTAPVIAIAPATPTLTDDLLCDIVVQSTDLDLETVTYDYSWDHNGTATTNMTNFVPAASTSDLDLWECTVLPTDGTTFGPAVTATATVCDASTWYYDGDNDGFGDFYTSVVACAPPLNYVLDYGDCDDNDASVVPFGGDSIGGADTDCDGLDCEAGDLIGAYFVFCVDNGGWSEAETACQAAGYQGLASILSAGEEAYAQTLIAATPGGSNQDPWMGFTDLSSPGTFAWTDGSPTSYTNWGPGQPDGGGAGNQCAVLDANGGDWNDVTCTQSTPGWTSYLCGDR